MQVFRAGFLFSGLGAGARGFLEARARLAEDEARFSSVGGIDVDAEACADFEQLTRSPALQADVAGLTPGALRAAWGECAPDCVFASPPCKGFSSLLSAESAERPEYQALNRLVLQGIWLLLETWATPPATIVLENVPRIVSRGAELLGQVRDLLVRAGYRVHEGQHDCGEIGGLAQHRRRFLLVARLERSVPAFIYRPHLKRVRGCGEVLNELPIPLGAEGAAAGAMHALPKISRRTWLRLALIPPGGDHRDLPGGVREGKQRRAVWARYDVRRWTDAARTVAGEGSSSNGGFGVADPRVVQLVGLGRTAERADTFKGRPGLMRVADWRAPTSAITASASPTGSNGVAAVADPRELALGCAPRAGAYGVLSWAEAASTITGHARVDNGRFAVADPRRAPAAPLVIRSAWNCWHRPLTTLEKAALQGLPTVLDGMPLMLSGGSATRWCERIGNAVPVGAARAVAESVLVALLAGALGTWTLGSTGIWVRRGGRSEHEWWSERAGI